MPPTRGHERQRFAVLDEAHLLLRETDARIDRLVQRLDPSLPDEMAEFSYVQGMLRTAINVAERLADQADAREPDAPRLVSVPPEPGEFPGRGWFG